MKKRLLIRPADEYSQQTATANIVESTDRESVKSLDDLYRSHHSLEIQINGDNTVYNATSPMEYIFGDIR